MASDFAGVDAGVSSGFSHRSSRLSFDCTSTCSRVCQKSRGQGACGGNRCDRHAFCKQDYYSSWRVRDTFLVDFQCHQRFHFRRGRRGPIRRNFGFAVLKHVLHSDSPRRERVFHRNCLRHRSAKSPGSVHPAFQPVSINRQTVAIPRVPVPLLLSAHRHNPSLQRHQY